MQYDFKVVEEFIWFGIVAAGIALMEAFVIFEPEAVENWEFWAISLGGGLVRAFAGGVLSRLSLNR